MTPSDPEPTSALVEAQPADGEGAVEMSRLRRLLEHMPGLEPIALHCAERVAVQVRVDAPGEVEALSIALTDLRAGLPRVGLGDLRVMRAEVLTWEEFEEDCASPRTPPRREPRRWPTPTTPAAPATTCFCGRSRTR